MAKTVKELNELDSTILRNLLEDGRKNFTLIAEQCDTSEAVIWKHYRAMKKAGIIVGATIQYNYQKYGYEAVADIQLAMESQYIDCVLERLRTFPGILCSRQYGTKFALGAITLLRNLKDLEHVKETISQRNPIDQIKTHLWVGVKNIPENMFLNTSEAKTKEKNSQGQMGIEISSINLDEIDMKITDKLAKDGRVSFTKIAQEIGISTDTVVRRYKKLKKNNYLKVSIQFNPSLLGYRVILYLYLALTDQSQTKATLERLSKIAGITFLVKVYGDFDLLAAFLVKDFKGEIIIHEKVAEIPYIKRTETVIKNIFPHWPGPRQYITTF